MPNQYDGTVTTEVQFYDSNLLEAVSNELNGVSADGKIIKAEITRAQQIQVVSPGLEQPNHHALHGYLSSEQYYHPKVIH